ncbi:MAG TPA: phosphatidylserine/phosphatidylglycerophosphate/cardiolipin synthase family protein, partial [Chthoniobacteraceae bacterium]|nr:phosphatidylserine/phosphatidylglycerophosphate/cardiolipin synthase family protein [Chthoniobacteraceae bacterium]
SGAINMDKIPPDDLSVFFLAQGEQTADAVMARLVAFISAARTSLDMAFYDMRFSDALKRPLLAALRERSAAGVRIRICYDADKAPVPNVSAGQDPAPSGTGAFVQSLGFPFRRIGGMKLMHNKYIVRDGAAVWTGSTNMTDDAFTLMENNVVTLASPALAAYYTEDFEQLWQKEHIETTGNIRTSPVAMNYSGAPATTRVMFSPGCGLDIDAEIARRAANAKRRIRICSLLLNSGTLINALIDVLRAGRVPVDGVYDRTQMSDVYRQWQGVPSNRWKIPALHDIIGSAHLAGKNSTPYSPTSRHDFMHNKILVIDDTVITGSYNFSRSAEFNAENILMIESPALAECYSGYIDRVVRKYGGAPRASAAP